MSTKENIIERLSALLLKRKNSSDDSSYTAQLYNKGIEEILSKIDEEAKELIEAGEMKPLAKKEMIREAADLWYHTMVLLAFNEIDPMEVLKELERREGISGLEEKSRR